MADEFTKAALYWIRAFNEKTKEKVWMMKLIELLNEYEPYIAKDWEYQDNLWGYALQGNSALLSKGVAKTVIISKSYWFIKWLVENEKIDTDIVYKKWFLAKTYDKDEVWEYFEPYEEILMLLAIQDEPIEFLVSILK